MKQGWFNESRRHRLSALGIKTGRKVLPKKPISLLVGDQKMFYPVQKKKKNILEKTADKIIGSMAKFGEAVSEEETKRFKRRRKRLI